MFSFHRLSNRFIIFIIALVVVLSTGIWYYGPPQNILYAFQQSYQEHGPNASLYRIAVVTDMDTASKMDGKEEWHAYLKIGTLKREPEGTYSISWKEEKELRTKYNEAGRGLELSELVYFDGKLLTCDDRTGIIFQIDLAKFQVYPRYIFGNGDGNEAKGFKCEWMTVRDDKLYIGSMGKDWSAPDGTVINDHPNWVKIVHVSGKQEVMNWRPVFIKILESVQIRGPESGYMVHEAVNWDYTTKSWVFMPRRVAKTAYDEKLDAEKGSNLVFTLDEKFSTVHSKEIGDLVPTHGFSSFKFLPYRPNEVVALKSVETDNVIESYIMVFNVQSGEILMEETLIGGHKYEGVEFI